MKNKKAKASKHLKRRMAIKMQTPEERKGRGGSGSVFNSKQWNLRSAAIRSRLAKKAEEKAKKK